MVNLPHRFVPTTSRFVSPFRIVAQYGHNAGITAVSFSPCTQYFASADEDGWLRIWSLETLDILGIYSVGFKCDVIEWDTVSAVICRCGKKERRIELAEAAPVAAKQNDSFASVIRLLDAPEVTTSGDDVIVRYGDNEFVHTVPGLLECRLEPCERYAVALSASELFVFSAFEDSILVEMKPEDGKAWRAFHINWRGDFFVALQNDGSIWLCDAADHTISKIYKGGCDMTAVSFGGDKYVIYGDSRGNLTVYDIGNRAVLLRTPRSPIDFTAVYPSSEKVGFVALRSESATAFFSQSQEILSASPLPAAVRTSCPGMLSSELLVACADNMIYRIKLDDNSISKVCRFSKEIDVMACGNEALFVHYKDGSAAVLELNVLVDLEWKSKKTPLSLAISENGKFLCALFNDHVDIISAKKDVRRVEIKGGSQIICGKEKTANQLLVFMSDLRIMQIDMRTGECAELNRLDIDFGRIVSVAPAAKSYAFVLVDAEHGQRAVLKVGLNSGKSSVVLRIMAVGTQIYAASASEESVCVRNDATCLRIISDLKAYSIDDWSRSEPFIANASAER